MKKSLLSYWSLAWVFALVFTCSSMLHAQDRTVQGKVTDGDSGEALPGVNVVVKGSTVGTVTDIEGNYSLTVPQDAKTLFFSSVGYTTTEREIGNQSTINVTLAPDVQSLSEVVVVGYGMQEKRDVTASIASIDKEAIKRIPTASSVEAMQGQVAGVDIQQNGGRPGQNATVRVRGRRSINASNDPLYVIDGIPVTSGSGTIFDINPNDIESIEVLKDAAATAIYGSRGANGVILITTKRGSSGKTVVTYDGFSGVSSALRKVDMMNGAEFAAMKRESRRLDPETGQVAWNGVIPSDEEIFDDPVELESLSQDPVRSTDYQDLVLQNGMRTNHQVGVSGGNEKTQFNISVGYFNEEGIIPQQDYQRFTGRVNLDHKINDIFKVGISFLNSYSIQNWGSGAVWREAISNNPLGVPYDEEGNLLFLPTNDGIRTNPLSELVPGAYTDERRFTRVFAPIYLEANILEGLSYRLNFGPDIRYRRQGQFRGSLTNANRGGPGDAQLENNTDFGYTLENLLTYSKDLGEKHSLKLTVLQSIQQLRSERHESNVSNLPYESQQFYNIGTAEVKGDLVSRLEEWQLASWMGRVNYDLADKYLFQVSVRADGSSRLAEGNRWTVFPGVSVGWRVIDEPFMENAGFLSELKLRGSYGSVGNTSIDPYQTQGRLRRTVYAWDENPAFGFGLQEIPNPDLGWEISSTLDLGADFGLFDGRLSGSFDWYETNTTNLLLARQLPLTSGYGQILQNIGATRTKGVELGLSAVAIDIDNFSWNIDFNISRYREEITELVTRDAEGNPVSDVGNAWFIGQPIRVWYDYKKTGIWQADEVDLADQVENKAPGEIKLADMNGDGQITPDDRTILGSDIPDYFGGITNRFNYKGFDFSFFFYYRMGQMIRSRFHDSNNALFARYNNLDVDYWTIDNPTNAYPRPNQNQERPRDASTMSYFDGSFVKLRNVTLGYNFPNSLAEKVGMSGVRVYASAQNPWFWAKYETFDPEVGTQASSGDMPTSKLFLLGVNVQF
jgi:TonB-linked SusC/RagA family outer membrane protein